MKDKSTQELVREMNALAVKVNNILDEYYPLMEKAAKHLLGQEQGSSVPMSKFDATPKPLVKYMHIREKEVVRTQHNTTYLKLAPKGGLTVAYYVDGDTIRFGVAKCHPDDLYCKATGREVAYNNLFSIGQKCTHLRWEMESTYECIMSALKDFGYKV